MAKGEDEIMADFNSSVPVRTETTGAEAYGLISKIADANTPTQQLAVNADGAASVVVRDVDIPAQTSDLKVTLDGEKVVLGASTENIGKVDVVSQPARSHTTDSIKIGDGADFLAINPDGSLNVAIVQPLSGGEVHDFNTGSTIAPAATSNHDYTVTSGKTLKLFQVFFSGSGKVKVELQVETGVGSGVFNTRAVGFFDGASPGSGTGEFRFHQPIEVPGGYRVRVIRTNRANQSQDLYSTIIGEEI
jgi:hypothetical protein